MGFGTCASQSSPSDWSQWLPKEARNATGPNVLSAQTIRRQMSGVDMRRCEWWTCGVVNGDEWNMETKFLK
eukprot:3541984-Pleurochrysis_carterae.AAC.1